MTVINDVPFPGAPDVDEIATICAVHADRPITIAANARFLGSL
jgi:hypothetical protein